jgi:UDP-GlcNAc:undecaprenyl-phosphate GlcNAc-1-phosphate transferase
MLSALTLALAALIAAALVVVLLRIRGLEALPAPNRWHENPTPVAGGIAIFVAFVLALQPALLSGVLRDHYLTLIGWAAAAFAIGLWDDHRCLSSSTKLGAQIAIALGAAATGVRPDWLPVWLAVLVAALVLISCMNAFNLLDNIDGLSAGTAAIAAIGLALVGGLVPGSGSPVVAAALAGACLGFLPFNYWRNRRALIFMGDSGSHTLGFVVGGLALLSSPGGTGGAAAAIAAPLLILALPILDTGLVVIVRMMEGRPIWEGGRDHSSHRLVYYGLSTRRAVAVLLGISATCALVAIALVILEDALLTAVAGGIALAGLVGFASRLALVHESSSGATREARGAHAHPL